MSSTTFHALASNTRHVERERFADAVLAAYFAAPIAERTTETHTIVAALLATLKAHRRAALAMQHTPRTWPAALAAKCGADTSLVVRLQCSDHPTVGSTAKLEAAAADALVAALADGRTGLVDGLHFRARTHVAGARAAFLKALDARLSVAR